MKFGDIVFNGYASINNPQRVSIVVAVKRQTITCTDGHRLFDIATGPFLTVIGSLDLDEFHDLRVRHGPG